MKLDDNPNFDRDISSKAVVSNNRGALEELKSKREISKRLRELEIVNEQMAVSLNNITTMLTALLEKHAS